LRLSIICKPLAMHCSVLYTFFVYFGNVLYLTRRLCIYIKYETGYQILTYPSASK
jgi:hypothetical protein